MGIEIGDSSLGMVMLSPCISIWEKSAMKDGF